MPENVIMIAGIAFDDEEAATKPKPALTRDLQTLNSVGLARIWIGIEQIKPEAEFGVKMLFDNILVESGNHEKLQGGSTKKGEGKYKPYWFDLPERFLTVRDKPHTIQFVLGEVIEGQFQETGKSDVFTLMIPTEQPAISEKVDPKDSD